MTGLFLAGGVGIGLVWGWLAGVVLGMGETRRPIASAVSLALATAALAAEVWWLVGERGLVPFLLAAPFGLALVSGLRWSLRRRLVSGN